MPSQRPSKYLTSTTGQYARLKAMKTRGMTSFATRSTLSPKAFLPERMWTVMTMNSRMQEKTKIMQTSIQTSRRETLETLGTFCLTELNMAVRVSKVVIPIPTRPGTDSGGTKRESQAMTTKTVEGM